MSKSESKAHVYKESGRVLEAQSLEQIPRTAGRRNVNSSLSRNHPQPPASYQRATMTPGSILTLCLWICLFFCYCTETQGERAMDCCLSVSSKPIPSHVLRTYVRQNGGSGCERSAVVFITRKNIKLCATPEQPWVRGHINKLDKLQRYCKVKKFQGQKCQELKVILESLVV